MAVTPDEWLPILTKRLDDEQPRLRRLRQYVSGDAPLPEMGANLRASWQRFQRKARTSPAILTVACLADRIVPNGIEVGGDTESPAAVAARRVWRNNRMDLVVKDFIWDMLTYRYSFLCVWQDEDESAAITAESPEFMYAATDPLRPWIIRAAIKVWRDEDAEKDYAYVWVRGGRQKYEQDSYEIVKTRSGREERRLRSLSSSGDWRAVGEFEEIDGSIPVFIAENPGGAGEFELHTDLLDRINHGVLQRLVTTAMQAFRQRALKRKAGDDAADVDEDDDSVDYSKVFEPAPGALWDLPDGVDLWESQTTDINPMLTAEKADLRDYAAMTRTPLPMLVPEGANQSAAGAVAAKEGLIAKARDRITVVQIVLASVLLKALQVEGVDVEDETVTVLCQPPHLTSDMEKYQAAVWAKSAGESWKSIARNILGYSPDQIRQDELDRADEQLAMATLVGGAGGDTGATVDDAAMLKARTDALGAMVRAGADPEDAAKLAGLEGLTFLEGVEPVTLRKSNPEQVKPSNDSGE